MMKLFKEFYLQDFFNKKKKEISAELSQNVLPQNRDRLVQDLVQKYEVPHFNIDTTNRQPPEIVPNMIRGFEFPDDYDVAIDRLYAVCVLRYHFKSEGDTSFLGARCRFNYLRDDYEVVADGNDFYIDFQAYSSADQIDDETCWTIKNQVSTLRDVFKMQTQQMNEEMDDFNRSLMPYIKQILQ